MTRTLRPVGDYLDEAGQSCARALFKRSLEATRVWSLRAYWEADGGVMPARLSTRTAVDGSDGVARR